MGLEDFVEKWLLHRRTTPIPRQHPLWPPFPHSLRDLFTGFCKRSPSTKSASQLRQRCRSCFDRMSACYYSQRSLRRFKIKICYGEHVRIMKDHARRSLRISGIKPNSLIHDYVPRSMHKHQRTHTLWCCRPRCTSSVQPIVRPIVLTTSLSVRRRLNEITAMPGRAAKQHKQQQLPQQQQQQTQENQPCRF